MRQLTKTEQSMERNPRNLMKPLKSLTMKMMKTALMTIRPPKQLRKIPTAGLCTETEKHKAFFTLITEQQSLFFKVDAYFSFSQFSCYFKCNRNISRES